MEITKRSPFTGKDNTMDLPITQEAFNAWVDADPRPFVQVAFPNLTSAQREFLVTGITDEEWDEYLGEEDEDDSVVVAEEVASMDDSSSYTDDDVEDWSGKNDSR